MSNVVSGQLIQLPVSGDLWRGHVRGARASDNKEVVNDTPRPFAKIDESIAQMLKLANGHKELTCLWCGLQMEAKPMREHITKNHASVVAPPSDDKIAAALVAVQKAKTE